MNTRGFETRNEAITRQIIEPIQGSGEVTDAEAEYDVQAIANKVLLGADDGYLVAPEFGGLTEQMIEAGEPNDAGEEAFWNVVRECER